MAITVKVTGFKELEAELMKLSKAAGRGVLTRAGLKALEPMARLARSLAPVDEGDLQESIDVGASAVNDVGKSEYAAVMRAGGSQADAVQALRDARRNANGSAVTLFMGPTAARDKNDAIKAIVQEYGSSNQPPQPYMRPAFDAQAQPTIERLKVELMDEIDRSVARAARKAARAAARG